MTTSFLSPIFLFNWMQDTAIQKLIIDVRPSEVYNSGYIRTALNVPITQDPVDLALIDKSLSSKTKSFKSRGVVFSHAVVYDDGSEESACRMAEALAAENKVKHLYILQGGFKGFYEIYPFLCSTLEKKAEGPVYPTEIQRNFLYLGSHENAKNRRQLKDLGITHVLNMAGELENEFPDEFLYCHYISSFVDRAILFIEDAKLKQGKVLAHCAMGISRSSAIVIAFLMHENKWSFQQALAFVKQQRSYITFHIKIHVYMIRLSGYFHDE